MRINILALSWFHWIGLVLIGLGMTYSYSYSLHPD